MSGAVYVKGMEHTGMIASDPEKIADWHKMIFGAVELSRSPDNPPIVFLSFGGGSLLELVPGSGLDAVPSDHVHLSLSVESLETAVEELEREGITLEKPVFKAYEGSPVAFLRDPEGNLLQLVERVSDLHSPDKPG